MELGEDLFMVVLSGVSVVLFVGGVAYALYLARAKPKEAAPPSRTT